MLKIIKKKLPLRFKMKMKYFSSQVRDLGYSTASKPRIFVMLAADYGNLGDVAITYAQTKFLSDNFEDYDVIDFPISKTVTHLKSLKKVIKSDDIITIVGGGNTGDLYDGIEYCRQLIIKNFHNNKIVSFPQTINYSSSKMGKRRLAFSKKIYGNHPDLTLVARERRSYNKYKHYYPKCKVVFTPDIVLSYAHKPKSNRSGALFCMRNDKEKLFDSNKISEIENMVSSFQNIEYRDTHVDKDQMSITEREVELDKIWSAFASKKLVVTDRLHGMIFAVITGTPCIAFDNTTKKVSGVYNEWLSSNNKVHVIENYNQKEFQEKVNKLLVLEDSEMTYQAMYDEFSELIESINN